MPFVSEELKKLSKQILDRAVLKQQPISPFLRLREAIQRKRQLPRR